MNKRASQEHLWPERPYLGLDYFREKDAPLFFERGSDVPHCANLLLGFGVKILILQGSSGAGKSSFLHAGLNPYLRGNRKRPVHFLGEGDGIVIRCTFDPLQWIGRALRSAIENKRFPFGDEQQSAECYLDDERLAHARALLDEAAFQGPRKGLADAILDSLEAVCGDLPGKLVLIVDQAEEVLTQIDSDLTHADTDSGFFYFLDEVYLRDIDVRIVVSLRTEYYGRFRDELNIRDDRLGARPRSGGVTPYLLRPIRDRQALIQIALAPSLGDAHATYRFQFEPGAAERIVDDLLKRVPHGSVTPLLQLICAVLYDGLDETRTITVQTYERLQGIEGIAEKYANQGLYNACGELAPDERDRWFTLLHSLVSRQGGGTLVSEIETLTGMRERAHELGINEDVGPVLVKLCEGRSPLLRGQPAENPVQFSLRHDVLAVIFYRWKVQNETRIKEREEAAQRLRERADAEAKARKRRLAMAGASALAVAVMLVSFAWHQHAVFRRLIDTRIALAQDPPRSDFGYSLLALVGNLEATSHDSIAARLRSFLVRPFPEQAHREKTIATLRETLHRTPWRTGEYLGAGLNREGDAALLLGQDGMIEQVSLTASGQAGLPLKLPRAARRALDPRFAAPVGFLDGIGPAAVVANTLYFWPGEAAEAKAVAISTYLPAGMAEGVRRLRYEFVGGALQITAARPASSANDKITLFAVRLSGKEILAGPAAGRTASKVAELERESPLPLFREHGGARDFAYITRGVLQPPNRAHPEAGEKTIRGNDYYGLTVGELGGRASKTIILESESEIPESRYFPYTITFVSNDHSILIGGRGADFAWSKLVSEKPGSPVAASWPAAPIRVQIPPPKLLPRAGVVGAHEPPAQRLDAYIPSTYAPLAAVKLGDRLRFAWPSVGGIQVAETRPGQNGTFEAERLPQVTFPLLAGEPGASKLRFSANGDFLLLQQQPQFGRPMRVRIWNFSKERHDWIQAANTDQLRAEACGLVRQHREGLRDAESILRLFDFLGVRSNPC